MLGKSSLLGEDALRVCICNTTSAGFASWGFSSEALDVACPVMTLLPVKAFPSTFISLSADVLSSNKMLSAAEFL